MKLFKLLTISLLLTAFASLNPVLAKNTPCIYAFNGYPAKTIVIKHPAANDTKTFFEGSQVYQFEIYKAGTAVELNFIIQAFLKDKDVQSCTQGAVAGDFTGITLTLKANKNKAWFVARFKIAGLNTIKINQGEVISVDKL